MYDSVLVPTDGSAVADQAVEHAMHIAKQNDAELHVVHVVDPDAIPVSANAGRVEDELTDAGERILEDVRDRAVGKGLYVETELLLGTPHVEILDYVDDHEIDLVVMGTHGRGGVSRLLLGSTTERVVRSARVPVLTVHLDEEPGEQ
ncbi:universal stress protein [Halocalculus aciditolerans]|uniref:Universal stress protein UspA n=1 Tax=Halocalculus aciditolerans TaxID=1383812 RepID=A0A830F6R4_9EURY|nr:universal stress protein [Halocalculus aciditolerans]GGL59998.1 universal stress protein UspA [Halocalculus aciditolerans]